MALIKLCGPAPTHPVRRPGVSQSVILSTLCNIFFLQHFCCPLVRVDRILQVSYGVFQFMDQAMRDNLSKQCLVSSWVLQFIHCMTILMRNKTMYMHLRSFLLWQSWSFYQSDTSFSGQWVSVSPKPTCTRDFIERYKNIQCYHKYIYIYPMLNNLNVLSCFSQDKQLFPTDLCMALHCIIPN